MIRELLYCLKIWSINIFKSIIRGIIDSGDAILSILAIFFVYMRGGIVATSFIYLMVVGPREHKPDVYCSWTPSRPISSVYWVVEWLPKKTSCFIWNEW